MPSIILLWRLIKPSDRAIAFQLLGLMLIGMVLEMLGLGVVIPALTLMATDTGVTLPPLIEAWTARLGNPSREVLLLGGLIAFVALYAFKAAFLLYSTWRQNLFVRALQCELSARLFATYLAQPWTFFLQRNSAELVRNVTDVAQLASLLTVLLATIAELFVLLGIIALLLVIEPLGALSVGLTLAGGAWLLGRLTKERLKRWGKQTQHHTGLLGKHLLQGLHAARDIKVNGCEAMFVENFEFHSSQRAAFSARNALVTAVPRLWFELIAVASLCVLTAVMVWQGLSTKAMIPTLGLFAAAAFRLLPSVNKLTLGLQNLRYTRSIVDTVVTDLQLPNLPLSDMSVRNVKVRHSIVLDNVSYCYPGASRPSLVDVSLEIPRFASVGLIGGSGAGKSTLIDIILGLLEPSTGRILVDGVDVQGHVRSWQREIGYVPQAIYLCDDTIRRNVAFGRRDEAIDDEAVLAALDSAQLLDFVKLLPQGVDTEIGERGMRLSGGQRQRIGIARALYTDPPFLILDEATSALDNATERDVMTAIESLHGRKTMLIVAHRLTTVAKCTCIVQLEGGQVVQTTSPPGALDSWSLRDVSG
jgi:ABC-type multidrug transport system fused ATPase/permease subunit